MFDRFKKQEGGEMQEEKPEEETRSEPIEEEIESEAYEVSSKISDDFAFKLVNAVKSMNQGEISYYELVNSFSLADELKCLYLFVKDSLNLKNLLLAIDFFVDFCDILCELFFVL